jgi:putative membrane protein
MTLNQLLPGVVAGLVVTLAAGTMSTAGAQAAAPVDDGTFVQQAASGGLAEVELGKLAEQKGSSAEVKQFGRRMVTDHTRANQELAAAAQEAGITPPSAMLPKHRQTVDRLSARSGKAFDKAYMTTMVKDHTEDVALFQQEAQSGKADALKEMASTTVPTLQQHLILARQVATKVGTDSTGADQHAEGTSSSR